jgi:hypothetical protein
MQRICSEHTGDSRRSEVRPAHDKKSADHSIFKPQECRATAERDFSRFSESGVTNCRSGKPAPEFEPGDLRLIADNLDSEAGGMTHRGFCPECGSPIVVNPDAGPPICGDQNGELG